MSIFSAIIKLFRKKKSIKTAEEEKKVIESVPAQSDVNAISPNTNKSPAKEQTQYRRNSQGNYNIPHQGQKTAGISHKYRYKRRYYNRPKNKPSTTNTNNTQKQSSIHKNGNPPKPMRNEPQSKK